MLPKCTFASPSLPQWCGEAASPSPHLQLSSYYLNKKTCKKRPSKSYLSVILLPRHNCTTVERKSNFVQTNFYVAIFWNKEINLFIDLQKIYKLLLYYYWNGYVITKLFFFIQPVVLANSFGVLRGKLNFQTSYKGPTFHCFSLVPVWTRIADVNWYQSDRRLLGAKITWIVTPLFKELPQLTTFCMVILLLSPFHLSNITSSSTISSNKFPSPFILSYPNLLIFFYHGQWLPRSVCCVAGTRHAVFRCVGGILWWCLMIILLIVFSGCVIFYGYRLDEIFSEQLPLQVCVQLLPCSMGVWMLVLVWLRWACCMFLSW